MFKWIANIIARYKAKKRLKELQKRDPFVY